MTHEPYPDSHHDTYSKTIFGFWLYLMTDFILFSTLFAVYAVLHKSTFGGPGGKELFNINYTFVQTLMLLLTSLFAGFGGAYVHRRQKKMALLYFGLTFLFGLIFLWMQMGEYSWLISDGNGWKRSGFLSAFFTIVGTFSLHVVFGLLWTIVLVWPLFKEEVSADSIKRLTCLRMFWQFLNIVWLFIFAIVYLLGVI